MSNTIVTRTYLQSLSSRCSPSTRLIMLNVGQLHITNMGIVVIIYAQARAS